jgi:hypothetical protein
MVGSCCSNVETCESGRFSCGDSRAGRNDYIVLYWKEAMTYASATGAAVRRHTAPAGDVRPAVVLPEKFRISEPSIGDVTQALPRPRPMLETGAYGA